MTGRKFQGQHTLDLAFVGNPARCSAAERKRFFGSKRAGCLSSPQANEFLPAPKKRLREGSHACGVAKLWGVLVKDIGNTNFKDMGYTFKGSLVIIRPFFWSFLTVPRMTGPK